MNPSHTRSLSRSTSLSLLASMTAAIASASVMPSLKTSISKPKYAFPTKLKTMFDDLPKVDITDIDIDLIIDNLKPEHGLTIKSIYQHIKSDEEITEVNKFEDWTNQFLGQLLFLACKILQRKLIEEYDIVGNESRYASIKNDISVLGTAFNYFAMSKITRLISAQESSNSYPISKEGATFIKEFASLHNRFKVLSDKIKAFKKSQK